MKLLPGASRIELQTFPRLFGFVFNPVSFWFCRDENDALRVLIAEVNNTFREHHFYVVTSTTVARSAPIPRSPAARQCTYRRSARCAGATASASPPGARRGA